MSYIENSDNNDELLRCISEVSNGNYMVSSEAAGKLSEAFNAFVEGLSSKTQHDMSNVVKISIKVGETAIFSANMLSNLRKVDAQSQGIAAAAEEMVATVQEIGNYGENIAEQARDAQQAVQLGADATSKAVEGMERITESVNSSADQVKVLNEFSDNIGKIAQDIKKIADQTNLLALNATIEAARAGEAGKGFAVVAGEVKSLAGQTKKSTDEIDGIISDLQTESRNILNSMEKSSQAVGEGQEAIAAVGQRMEDINEKINEVTQNTSNIAHTLSEQKQASQEVAQGITEIAANSSESVEGIDKIVDAMNEVEGLTSGQIAEMAKLEVPGKVVKLAQSDHVIWVKKLANMVVGREGLNPSELADHHTCRLGKWYDNITDSAYTSNPAFAALAEPHKTVHTHGIKAVELYNDKNLPAALEEIAKVEVASKEVLRLLAEMDN